MGVFLSIGTIPNSACPQFKSEIATEEPAEQVAPGTEMAFISRYYKHTIHVICMVALISAIMFVTYHQQDDLHKSGNELGKEMGQFHTVLAAIATMIQLTIILPFPSIICTLLGLLLYNAFPGEIKLDESAALKKDANARADSLRDGDAGDRPIRETPLLPHLCFRVVTRGLYPSLVQDNVRKNLLTCRESRLENFSIEVVTDREIQLDFIEPRVKQIVVPKEYKTPTGALFKARALQYALEPGTSSLMDHDYIVHLDEETIVTQNVINGILNFALKAEHDFGQGLITYANLGIVNLVTTLADSYRVADDMGRLQFTLRALHKPIFGWKGSFVVSRCGAEKNISFDHGPDGSIAEDCYFSMVASSKGYSFDFIQGEMYEKSPFTIMDQIRQRKRWGQGIWLVVHSTRIPVATKFFLAMTHYAWLTLPLAVLNYVVTMFVVFPAPIWLRTLGSFCFGVTLYMYIIGLVRSFDFKKQSIGLMLVYLIGQILTLTLNWIVENIAVIWALLSNKHNFYIVKKEVNPRVLLDP